MEETKGEFVIATLVNPRFITHHRPTFIDNKDSWNARNHYAEFKMSRIPLPGRSAYNRDAQYLMKIKRRVEVDAEWKDVDRKRMEEILVEAINLLLKGKGQEPVVVPIKRKKQA